MVFSSTIFLFAFLPIVFGLYCVIPSIKIKNVLLIAASLFFYAFGEPFYVVIMLLSAVMNYIFGALAIKDGLIAKAAIYLAVIFNLAVIGVFKYTDFLVESLNKILLTELPSP